MPLDSLLNPCPVCNATSPAQVKNGYRCSECGLTIGQKKQFFRFRDKQKYYVVKDIGESFSVARDGLVGQVFTLPELKVLPESLYSDQVLARFAEGDFEALNTPSSTLAQILLEQLRETCAIQINQMRRARGPILTGKNSCLPEGKVPSGGLQWQDRGNLFLTNIRLVFPSNTFTFVRLDRKITGLKTYEDGLALQRRGEEFATYFAGCRSYQAALAAAYIVGKVPHLRPESAVTAG
jgi:hypothetical protein